MSEEKLYVIKSRSGDEFYFSGDRVIPNWSDNLIRLFGSYEVAKEIAEDNNGQPVTFVEEPKKVVLTKEQAEIVEGANKSQFPADYITQHTPSSDDEKLIMEAFVNGWTVEKPKRYVLLMPGTDYHNYQMHGNAQYYAVKGTGNWRPDAIALGTDDAVKHGYTVTQSDIDAAPAWVKAIKPLEVTDDDDEV